MIEFLRGRLILKSPPRVVIEVQGVGYGVEVPFNVFTCLGKEGDEVSLYTYLYLREDQMRLYGFLRKEEREMFSRLVSVGGVGPRKALGILSRISPEEFDDLLQRDDVESLSSLPGVGKKLSQKIFLELRGKLRPLKEDELTRRCVEALMELGSTSREARELVNRVRREHPELHSEEEILREALKRL